MNDRMCGLQMRTRPSTCTLRPSTAVNRSNVCKSRGQSQNSILCTPLTAVARL